MLVHNMLKNSNIYHLFQPIFSLNGLEKIGYEVLLRSKEFPNPEMAFQEARKEKQLYELDSHSIYKAIQTYLVESPAEKEEYLFVNIFPSTILHHDFPYFIKTITSKNYETKHVNTSIKIVLEITESEEITDLGNFKERLLWLKQQGFLIAIDDIGKGYNFLQLYIDLDIDFLKLDRYFAKDLHLSKKKQGFISLFLEYCEQYGGSKLILEGVENEQEMAIANKLKIPYAQGYHLGRPALLQQYCKS